MNLPLAFGSYLDVPLKHHPWCCLVAVASTSSSLSIICIGTTKLLLEHLLLCVIQWFDSSTIRIPLSQSIQPIRWHSKAYTPNAILYKRWLVATAWIFIQCAPKCQCINGRIKKYVSFRSVRYFMCLTLGWLHFFFVCCLASMSSSSLSKYFMLCMCKTALRRFAIHLWEIVTNIYLKALDSNCLSHKNNVWMYLTQCECQDGEREWERAKEKGSNSNTIRND